MTVTKKDQHPITPPPELVQQWADMIATHTDTEVFSAAAQWGADQELEACCVAIKNLNWFIVPSRRIADLRADRRPKPPSLKERVAISLARPGDRTRDGMAADAIRAVAAWLKQEGIEARAADRLLEQIGGGGKL